MKTRYTRPECTPVTLENRADDSRYDHLSIEGVAELLESGWFALVEMARTRILGAQPPLVMEPHG